MFMWCAYTRSPGFSFSTLSRATSDLDIPLCSLLNRNCLLRLDSWVRGYYLYGVHVQDVDLSHLCLGEHLQHLAADTAYPHDQYPDLGEGGGGGVDEAGDAAGVDWGWLHLHTPIIDSDLYTANIHHLFKLANTHQFGRYQKLTNLAAFTPEPVESSQY
jgi:hypothetical protein